MSRVENLKIVSEHDGLELAVTCVSPETPPRCLVQFAHGMAEHKQRYLPVMSFLAAHGCACFANDHRGHGASIWSPDDLGFFYADGGRGLVNDMHQLTLWFKSRFPNTPIVLVGHSMGSLAARDYAARFGQDIDGLVLSGSPGRNPAAGAGLLLTELLTVVHRTRRAKSLTMDALVNGGFSRRYKKDGHFAWLSANPNNVAAYEADPLCGFGFTLNGYRALLKMMIAAYDPRATIRRGLPVHFMSGADDPCAPNRKGFEAAMDNLRRRGCAQVTGTMYPGLRHEIFNEGVQQVFDDLLSAVETMIQ